ncbi:6789_t:CDS:1 [Funneliformis geosporum]|uniref:1155_t:CDS:1 n=1 Tax=Funneliformis geosporum TaxID=1117311 RepID=A0A9W4SR31_9GLOM|nr:1155_t:CDS:1 [Funneliformis geosporum]CAI2178880.1 6789_t:CDS:1 [Funneliformis geosporum]
MGKSKALQLALEQLSKQQNDISTSFQTSASSTSFQAASTLPSKRPKCDDVPEDLDLNDVYYPKYSVLQLISTRRKPRTQSTPPRPPNSFFLMKNCYMLELRKLGYRFCMPDVCRQSKQIWSNIPIDVKERYDNLALQAQILHQEMYPGYKFQPKKRQIFKSHVFPTEENTVDSSMINTFSMTNFLANNSTTKNDIKTKDSELSGSPRLRSPPQTPPQTISSPTVSSTSSSSTVSELDFSPSTSPVPPSYIPPSIINQHNQSLLPVPINSNAPIDPELFYEYNVIDPYSYYHQTHSLNADHYYPEVCGYNSFNNYFLQNPSVSSSETDSFYSHSIDAQFISYSPDEQVSYN